MSAQQLPLIVDSVVVSSTIVPNTNPPPAPAVPPQSKQTPLPQSAPRGIKALALKTDYSPVRVERMYKRHLPIPSSVWDSIKWIAWTAHPRAPLIVLAREISARGEEPAFVLLRPLTQMLSEITLTKHHLFRIVELAKQKNILQ